MVADTEHRTSALVSLFAQLPEPNLTIIVFLLDHLVKSVLVDNYAAQSVLIIFFYVI